MNVLYGLCLARILIKSFTNFVLREYVVNTKDNSFNDQYVTT